MSETLVRPAGSGSGGAYANLDRYALDDANQMRIYLNKLGFAALQRNIRLGGSRVLGIEVHADGDIDLEDAVPLELDNRSTQFSGFSDSNGATLIVQARFLVRVSDAAVSVTPKLRYGSTLGGITNVATISGAAACSATAVDYSGTNSYQTIGITLPTGKNLWKPQLTVAGTGGNSYTVWGLALLDFYVDSTP